MICARCPADVLPANLCDGICPECKYAIAAHQITHQVAAPPARLHEDHGLRVEDVPRGMAGRLQALARRRTA
jgi:hypothetical protein